MALLSLALLSFVLYERWNNKVKVKVTSTTENELHAY